MRRAKATVVFITLLLMGACSNKGPEPHPAELNSPVGPLEDRLRAAVARNIRIDAVKDLGLGAPDYTTETEHGMYMLRTRNFVSSTEPHEEPLDGDVSGFVGWIEQVGTKSNLIGIKWDKKNVPHFYRGEFWGTF